MVKYDNIHNDTVERHLTGKGNIFAGAYDTQERRNTQHFTPTKKCGHHGNHAAEDGDSDAPSSQMPKEKNPRTDSWDALMEEKMKAPSLVPRAAVENRSFLLEEYIILYNRKKEWVRLRYGYEENQTAEEWSVKYDNIHNETVEWHRTGKDNIFALRVDRWDTWDALMEEQIKAPSLVSRADVRTWAFYIEEGVIQNY